jgi:lysophospholipase L1-like esterase
MLALTLALAAAAPVRIWCLGDSITGSPGCWRALLWRQLQQDGYTNTKFVGTLQPQGCGFQYDGMNDGHGGALAITTAKGTEIDGWIAVAAPDVTIMHLGTNDCWGGRPTDAIIDAFTTILGKIRKKSPTSTLMIAKIIPLEPRGGSLCAECPARVKQLNAQIDGWATQHATATSPIVVVDCWTGWNSLTDTNDGAHPNDAGNVKMAAKWLKPLEGVLDKLGGK